MSSVRWSCCRDSNNRAKLWVETKANEAKRGSALSVWKHVYLSSRRRAHAGHTQALEPCYDGSGKSKLARDMDSAPSGGKFCLGCRCREPKLTLAHERFGQGGNSNSISFG